MSAWAMKRRFADYVARHSMAISTYYGRFGFHSAKTFGLDNEYGVSDEFMVRELRVGCLNGIRGLVRYAPEFSEV